MNPTIPAVPTSSHVPRAAVVGPKIKISPRHGTTSVGPIGSVAYPVPGTSVIVQVRMKPAENRRCPSLIREGIQFRSHKAEPRSGHARPKV